MFTVGTAARVVAVHKDWHGLRVRIIAALAAGLYLCARGTERRVLCETELAP
jgi:hypothetical protein